MEKKFVHVAPPGFRGLVALVPVLLLVAGCTQTVAGPDEPLPGSEPVPSQTEQANPDPAVDFSGPLVELFPSDADLDSRFSGDLQWIEPPSAGAGTDVGFPIGITADELTLGPECASAIAAARLTATDLTEVSIAQFRLQVGGDGTVVALRTANEGTASFFADAIAEAASVCTSASDTNPSIDFSGTPSGIPGATSVTGSRGTETWIQAGDVVVFSAITSEGSEIPDQLLQLFLDVN